MKKIIGKRKKLRKKGLLSNHDSINNGARVYCNNLSIDGHYRYYVTIGDKCKSTDTTANVSWHFRTIKAARPLKCEEVITKITPFQLGDNPKIVLSNGEVIDTVLVSTVGRKC